MIPEFELRKVQYMPSRLEPGILYVAEQFKAAAHLCACGCGSVVRTPLNRWTLVETEQGPSLYPSIGNWQEPCQSHYWIEFGKVRTAPKWSPADIEAGRHREQARLSSHYNALELRRKGIVRRFWNWVKAVFGA
jgi:hypothetical protein